MPKKKVLIVTQEMEPYTSLSEISKIVKSLPTHIHKNGYDIRILMPRFGVINERRHRLHEVVRLSGMNIIVDDDDYPLIIKVASLPGARLQVYFLDNEEFFKRKFIFTDKNEKVYDDNAERMIFFCKGAIETVKKFGWPPDIIHCHGWMTGLIPLYLKTAYKDEPLFEETKVIYSMYNEKHLITNTDRFEEKASINYLKEEDLDSFVHEGELTIEKGAGLHADGIIVGSNEPDDFVSSLISEFEIPVLQKEEGEENLPLDQYVSFYRDILPEED